jgi:hypothetical protein
MATVAAVRVFPEANYFAKTGGRQNEKVKEDLFRRNFGDRRIFLPE